RKHDVAQAFRSGGFGRRRPGQIDADLVLRALAGESGDGERQSGDRSEKRGPGSGGHGVLLSLAATQRGLRLRATMRSARAKEKCRLALVSMRVEHRRRAISAAA